MEDYSEMRPLLNEVEKCFITQRCLVASPVLPFCLEVARNSTFLDLRETLSLFEIYIHQLKFSFKHWS